jgi:hypothetical protein
MRVTGSITLAAEAHELGRNFISEWRRVDKTFDRLCSDSLADFEIKATELIYNAAMDGDAGACFFLLNRIRADRLQLRRGRRGAA